MKIYHQNTDSTNGTLTIIVEQADYQKKADERIMELRKKTVIPGFRRGSTPLGIIKKKYMKSIIGEEVNEIVKKEVANYITEKDLDIIGLPLMKLDSEVNRDYDGMKFEFDMGFFPRFDMIWNQSKEYTKYSIQLSEEEMDIQILSLREVFGKFQRTESIKESNHVYTLYRIIKEKREENNSSSKNLEGENIDQQKVILKTEDLAKGKMKEEILNSEIGGILTFSSEELIKENEKLLQYFKLRDIEEIKQTPITIEIEIADFWRVILAEMNRELFKKIEADEKISSVEQLRAFVRKLIMRDYDLLARKFLIEEVFEDLIRDNRFDLPVDFIIKWLMFSNKEINSYEEAKLEYEKNEETMRSEMIQSELVKLFSIKVSKDEIIESIKHNIYKSSLTDGLEKMSDEKLRELINSTLKKDKKTNYFLTKVLNKKLSEKLFEKINITEKTIYRKEFLEIVEKRTESEK